MADYYKLIFSDWDKSVEYQARVLSKIIEAFKSVEKPTILDCACGVGTQAIGLSQIGYSMVGSDISNNEIQHAMIESKKRNLEIPFYCADFCNLEQVFAKPFDIVIAIDNAISHMLDQESLRAALKSIYNKIESHGAFIASIRDYDEILKTKPVSPPPYIIKSPTWKKSCISALGLA